MAFSSIGEQGLWQIAKRKSFFLKDFQLKVNVEDIGIASGVVQPKIDWVPLFLRFLAKLLLESVIWFGIRLLFNSFLGTKLWWQCVYRCSETQVNKILIWFTAVSGQWNTGRHHDF